MIFILKKNQIIIILFFLAFSLVGCEKVWNFERDFKVNSEGLDGGILYVYSDRVYFQVDKREKIKYKSVYDKYGNTIDQIVTEDWMKNSGDRLNRSYTELYRGFDNSETKLIFSKQAQNSSIAISEDKKTIYISTEFLDYKLAEVISDEDPNYDRKIYFYHLYKSVDGGNVFTEMDWPLYFSVRQLLFDDTGVYGYAVGGKRVLRRTSDGAKTWQAITIPREFRLPIIRDRNNMPNISLEWDAFYFDKKTKTLYLSCFVHDPVEARKGKSIIYAVPWDDKLVDLNNLKPVATIDNQFVTDIKLAGDGKFYLLTEVYPFDAYYTGMEAKVSNFIFLENNQIKILHKFGKNYLLGAFYVGQDNLLYIIGMKSTGIASYDDIAFISHDNGQSWKEEMEGSWGQGSYFDPKTNKAWLYKQGKLYSRIIK